MDAAKESTEVVRKHYRVMLELIAAKNPMLVEDLKRRDKPMGTTWRDIFGIDEEIDKKVTEEHNKTEEDTTIQLIENLMKTMQLPIEKAMDALCIASDKRAGYVEKIQKQTLVR